MTPKPYKKFMEKEKKETRHWAQPFSNVWWLLLALATYAIISFQFLPDQLSLKEGQYAPDNIYYFGSPVTYVSQEQTNEAKELVASEVGQVYTRDNLVVVDLHKQVDETFSNLYLVKSNADLTAEEQTEQIRKILGENISDTAIAYYLAASDLNVSKLMTTVKEAVANAYASDVLEEDLTKTVDAVKAEIEADNFLAAPEAIMLSVVDQLSFRANKVVDQVATMNAVEQAIASVQPIQVTVNPGELIVRQGEVVTALDLEKLDALGLQKQAGKIRTHIGLLILVALCYYLLRIYCTQLSKEMAKKQNNIAVLGVLLIVTLLIGRFLTLINIHTDLSSDLMMGLAIPVPAFAMLAAALVNRRAAIFATIIISIFIGIMCNGYMLYILAALVGGLVGVAQVRNLDKRGKYALASFNIALAYCLVVLAWSCIWDYSIASVGAGFLMGILNGVLSLILAIGTLPLLESAFKITTEVRLLELSNTNHPLLKKLMIEAPGTYNHSVIVGNLAEAAADEIGANGLLVRVAAYFHDIGKIKRPYFFIENQKPGENPHDKLQPSLSTFIITSHTKEGAELARKYKLPTEIVDIIEQHHGTSLVAGFYYKAKEMAENNTSNDELRESDFRYPGPKPQTKEAALLMLADSCQAAVQSMHDPTKGQMAGKIREVIKGKFEDGQLEHCDLTFRDLDIIATTFATVLAGVNHHRIAYPDQLEKELMKQAKEGKGAHKPKEKVLNKGETVAKQIIIEPTAQQGNAAVGQAEKPDQPTKISSEPSKEQSAAKQDNEKNKEAK